MRPRSRVTPVLGVALVAVLALVAFLAAPENLPWAEGDAEDRVGGDRPNFVVVMTDDQSLAEMDVMEHTERLLGEQGITFENAFVSWPLCCPSRATFLTGQHPHNHGLFTNRRPEGGFVAFDDEDTLPVALQDSGYTTALFGKYLNGYGVYGRSDPEFVPPGWSRWHALASRGYFDYTMIENGELRRYGDRPRDYQTDVLARKAGRFIRRASRRDVPFFVYLPTYAAHPERPSWGGPSPNPRPAPRHDGALDDRPFPRERAENFNPDDVSDKPSFIRERKRPRAIRQRSREARVASTRALEDRQINRLRNFDRHRAGSLVAVDEAVRTLVRQLRRSGELDNTHILFTSDQGFLLGEHRARSKQFLYEQGIRVPMLMRGPGLPPGRTISAPVSNVDLAPTILAVAGVEPLRTPDGIDLRPLIRRPREYADRDLLVANSAAQGVRSPRYLYVEHETDEGSEWELYDVLDDPFQLRNLVDASTGELRDADPRRERDLAALRARLDELRDCEGTSGNRPCI